MIMKKLTNQIIKTLGLLMLLTAILSSCKKDHKNEPAPVKTSSMTGTIDGKTINITESGLASTFYSSPGDPVSSLMTNATLDASGSAMTFFIPDISAGAATITPKLGTSSLPGNPHLQLDATGATTVQIYVSYTSGGNTYYAISGTITITYDDTKINVKWDIRFKDATGRVFASKGDFTIYFYKAVTKSKSEIKDPTPVSATPTIDDIAPAAGAAGDEVAIAGTNFSTATEDIVTFNGVAATVKTATATKLTVTVPQSTTGNVKVKVKNSAVTTGPTFTYVLPPTFTGMTPASGKAGDVLTITGTNFSTVLSENVISMNGTPAAVTAATATQIKATVPQGVTTGRVSLTVRGKIANPATGVNITFTVIPPPTITAMSPVTGTAGTVVTLTGTNFSTIAADNKVLFNGLAATVTSAAATQLIVTAPTGVSTGLVTVKVNGVDAAVTGGTATNTFTVIANTDFGTPGQAYGLNSVYFEPSYKAVDNDGNLWLVDLDGQINKESYRGGDQLKTITAADISFASLSSYLCRGIARDVNGGIHAYIYGSGAGGAGNPSFVVSISSSGVVTKDFETNFLEKSSSGFAITPAGEVLIISTRAGSSDIYRLKTDGTFNIYLKGGTGTDNTLGAENAYGMAVDGGSLYVLSYLTGSPNTGAVIARFDASKTRAVVATLPDGGYADGALVSSKFSNPRCFAVNGSSIFIGDGQRIRKLDTQTNTVTTFAGSGVTGTVHSGDALSVTLNAASAVLVDGNHNVVYNFGQFTNELTRIAY